MKAVHTIQRFEHRKLVIGEECFEKRHLDALLKLNEIHNFEYFESIPNGIKFKQYVGIIQIDNLAIEIFPKIDDSEDDNNWRDVLIQMLKTCKKLKASAYGDANVNVQNLNLLEIYFSIFLNEISGLIKQGLIKNYRTESSNLFALKGRISFTEHLKRNLIHKERFFTEHQIYDKDHELHQILNAALSVVEKFTIGTFLFDNCKRVLLNFPEVSEIKISKKLLDNFKITNKTKGYTRAFEIARLILLNYSPDISSGHEKMLALLFDMNKLWEEYVFIKLNEVLVDEQYEISGQNRKGFWRYNYLQPDIVFKNKNSEKAEMIIDTKWKRPNSSSASIQDLRQMYAYIRFWNASKAVLLYPGEPDGQKYHEFENEYETPKHKCKMAFVSVLNKDGKLNESLGEEILKEILQ